MLSWLSVICCERIAWIRVGGKGLIYGDSGGAGAGWGWQVGGDPQTLVRLLDGVSLLAEQQNILTTNRHGHSVPGRPEL